MQIESDFNFRFDGKSDIIYTKVAKLASAILAEAELRKISVVIENDVGKYASVKPTKMNEFLLYIFMFASDKSIN